MGSNVWFTRATLLLGCNDIHPRDVSLHCTYIAPWLYCTYMFPYIVPTCFPTLHHDYIVPTCFPTLYLHVSRHCTMTTLYLHVYLHCTYMFPYIAPWLHCTYMFPYIVPWLHCTYMFYLDTSNASSTKESFAVFIPVGWRFIEARVVKTNVVEPLSDVGRTFLVTAYSAIEFKTTFSGEVC